MNTVVYMNFKQFEISKIPDHAFCLCIGKRNTGKSTLLSRLVKEKQTTSVKDTLVMCGTQEEHDMYSKLNNVVIYSGYTPDILHTYTEKQKISLRKDSLGVVLDTIEYENIWKDIHVRHLVRNGRCFRTFLYCSSSCIWFIPPYVRSNIDYVFLFKELNKDNLERLYQSFGNMFETFKKFCEAFDTCTKELYGCMVIDNTSHSHRIEDVVFWFSV